MWRDPLLWERGRTLQRDRCLSKDFSTEETAPRRAWGQGGGGKGRPSKVLLRPAILPRVVVRWPWRSCALDLVCKL